MERDSHGGALIKGQSQFGLWLVSDVLRVCLGSRRANPALPKPSVRGMQKSRRTLGNRLDFS